MSRYNVTNRTSGLRKFAAADRFLTLAGGESARNIELTDDGAAALEATRDFDVRKIEERAAPGAEPPTKAVADNPAA